MSNILEYKGYIGTIEVAAEDNLLYGQVIGINSLISYEGKSIVELRKDFSGAVDTYLEHCAKKGKQPEKAYRGAMRIRMPEEVHRALDVARVTTGKSINTLIVDAVKGLAPVKKALQLQK